MIQFVFQSYPIYSNQYNISSLIILNFDIFKSFLGASNYNKLMYSQRYSKKCRYGASCSYNARGQCWFYHPENEIYGFGRSRFDESEDEDNNVYFRHPQTRSRNQMHRTVTRPIRSTRQSSQTQLAELTRLMELYFSLGLIGEKKSSQTIIKKKQEENNIFGVEKKKTLILKGKEVSQVKIDTKIPQPNAWFFKNSDHFEHFSECQYEECSICIEKYKHKQVVSVLLCKHSFHQDCIQQWLKKQENCPLCRHDFRTHEGFKTLRGYKKPQIKSKLTALRPTLSTYQLFEDF